MGKIKFTKIKNFFKKVKWFFKEIMKIYSNEPSYFSKKRIESGIAFVIAQFGMVFYLVKKIDLMDAYDLGVWAGIEFLIAGYTVTQIQKEKKDKVDVPKETPKDSGPEILND